MKNILIILISLLLFSNCTKTNSFNVATDLNGTWERTNDGRKDLTIYEIKNGGIEISIVHTYFPNEIHSDWATVTLDGYSYKINGTKITLYQSSWMSDGQAGNNNRFIGEYYVMPNKEKNEIVLMNTKNKSQINLIKQ